MSPESEHGTMRRDLHAVLLDAGLITAEQLQAAQQAQQEGQTITDVLLAQGVITPRDVATALSLQLNLPLIDLKRHVVQPQALSLVPEEIARRYNAVPLDIINGELIVVMENPLDIQALEDISIRAGIRARPMVGTRDDIQQAQLLYYRAKGEIERQLGQIVPEPTVLPEAPRLTAEDTE